MNRVQITGRIVAEPKTFNGGKILSFAIAVNEKSIVNGEEREIVSFFDVDAMGSASSIVLKKGDFVTVEGKLRQDRWETPTGEKKSKVKIIAFKISLPEKEKHSERKQAPQPAKQVQTQPTQKTKKTYKKTF